MFDAGTVYLRRCVVEQNDSAFADRPVGVQQALGALRRIDDNDIEFPVLARGELAVACVPVRLEIAQVDVRRHRAAHVFVP